MQISKGAVAFMMESSRMFTITDWAFKSKKKHEHDPKMWYVENKSTMKRARIKLITTRDDLVDNFSTHQDEVEKLLSKGVKKLGLNGR
jgi:homogentisate 1,2-dioxygenase